MSEEQGVRSEEPDIRTLPLLREGDSLVRRLVRVHVDHRVERRGYDHALDLGAVEPQRGAGARGASCLVKVGCSLT